MAEVDAAAEERRKRAQARKDKIAGRGADRLAKITGAAKGQGGEGERFGTGSSSSSPRPTTSNNNGTAASTSASPRASLPALAAPSFNPLDDPPDIDISSLQAQRGFQGIPDLNSNGADGGMPDMPDMLSALLSGGGMPQGQNGFPDLSQMFGGAVGQQPGSTPITLQPQRKRTWTDRLLPLMHLLSMVMLAFYAVLVIEPHVRQGNSAFSSFSSSSSPVSSWFSNLGEIDWYGWAALGRGKQGGVGDSTTFSEKTEQLWQQGAGRGVAGVQLIYMFLVLELMLQTAAILVFRTAPPIPSLLNSIMPYLPPKFAMYAHTGIKYWALLGQVLDDLAVLVLSIAGWILFAEWKTMGHIGEGKIKFD